MHHAVTMAKNHDFLSRGFEGQAKIRFSATPSLGYANFGQMNALGTIQLVNRALNHEIMFKYQDIYHIPGTFHCNVTKDFREKNIILGNTMESSDHKKLFRNMIPEP